MKPLTGAYGRTVSGFGCYPGTGGSIMAARTTFRSVKKKGADGQYSALGLKDDVEMSAGGLLRVRRRGELGDQVLLHREHRVGLDVGAAGHEDVRGQRAVPRRGGDEVDVRRAVRVALGRRQQRADRAVGRDRVVGRHDGAEPVGAVLIGGEQAAAVARRLHAGLLDVVKALVVSLPDVEYGAG